MKVISLFSGAGGLDLGLSQAGHEVIWANDNDADCVATYRRNIGEHIEHADIADVQADEVPDGDVIVGGFPCQGFSLANLRRSGADERNVLYLQFRRLLVAKRPRFFVAENVRGIMSLEGGAVFDVIVRGFKSAGYRVTWRVLNAADFGVPQTRHRVILLGTRRDLPLEYDLSFPQPTHRSPRLHRIGLPQWITIAEALAGIPEPLDGSDLPNHVCSKYKVTNRNFTGHRRTDPDRPSPTILARGNGQGGVCAIQHPNNHRRLSVRESAVVQTFPLRFEFSGRLNSMYRQVGNAVPVLLARHLGEKLKEKEMQRRNRR
jgi:DNA (cytosine-5)-methyltransferase 1